MWNIRLTKEISHNVLIRINNEQAHIRSDSVRGRTLASTTENCVRKASIRPSSVGNPDSTSYVTKWCKSAWNVGLLLLKSQLPNRYWSESSLGSCSVFRDPELICMVSPFSALITWMLPSGVWASDRRASFPSCCNCAEGEEEWNQNTDEAMCNLSDATTKQSLLCVFNNYNSGLSCTFLQTTAPRNWSSDNLKTNLLKLHRFWLTLLQRQTNSLPQWLAHRAEIFEFGESGGSAAAVPLAQELLALSGSVPRLVESAPQLCSPSFQLLSDQPHPAEINTCVSLPLHTCFVVERFEDFLWQNQKHTEYPNCSHVTKHSTFPDTIGQQHTLGLHSWLWITWRFGRKGRVQQGDFHYITLL